MAVTGVDLVEKALERGRERAREEGVEMRFVHGDVTDLRASDIGSGFRLVLDTGTFHGLDKAQRQAMGREIDAIAAPDATVLLLAWTPRRRGPFPSGVSPNEIQSAFPGWNMTDEGPTHFQEPKPIELLFKAEEHWYRLRRA